MSNQTPVFVASGVPTSESDGTSGPSVFGVFLSVEAAKAACQEQADDFDAGPLSWRLTSWGEHLGLDEEGNPAFSVQQHTLGGAS